MCESPNKGLEAGGGEGQEMELDPGSAGLGVSCHFPPPKKISLILDLSQTSSRTLRQAGGSRCREGDGAGLGVFCGVLVCLYISHSLPILPGGC